MADEKETAWEQKFGRRPPTRQRKDDAQHGGADYLATIVSIAMPRQTCTSAAASDDGPLLTPA